MRRTRCRALSQAFFSMTVPAMRGTATSEMIRATPTRNWATLEERNALDVYRKDASRGWAVRRSSRTSRRTRPAPRAIRAYGKRDSPEKMALCDRPMLRTVRAAPSTSAPK